MIRSLTFFCAIALPYAALPVCADVEDPDSGWTELFDGRSLDGWRRLGGEAEYRVEDGAIVGSSVPNTPNSFLCTEQTYGDWNELTLSAHGSRIVVHVNGRKTAELRNDPGRRKGHFGLQLHGGQEMDVQFRAIDLLACKAARPTEELAPGEDASAAGPVVPPGAKVEKIADGFSFTEGPAAGPDGRIYFSDIPNERIHVYDPQSGEMGIHREDSGRANGLMFAPSGALYACEGGARRLSRQVGDEIGVLADTYDEKQLNSPNDLVMDGRGGVYFTDPRYGNRDSMEMEIEGVYYLPRRGKLVRVVDDLVRPNGLILSLDNSILYVADNGAKTIVAYDVQSDGSLGNKRLFVDMEEQGAGGGDGMTIDDRGNVYCAAQGAVWIWDPAGQLVTKIETPEGPANCAFGGPEGKTLFITARQGLYSIDLNVKGGR